MLARQAGGHEAPSPEGISPLYDRDPGDGTDRADHFAIIVPSPLLDTDGYDIRVATLETVDGALAATELVSDD